MVLLGCFSSSFDPFAYMDGYGTYIFNEKQFHDIIGEKRASQDQQNNSVEQLQPRSVNKVDRESFERRHMVCPPIDLRVSACS